MKSKYILPYLIILLTIPYNFSLAQEVDYESLYESLEWKFVGPYRGGRSTTAVGLESKPYTFFMGTTGGGVWKTNDAGNTWNNV